jgi:NTP pyrophosphatase (non-canonical NTP hydrolase)
MPKVKKVKKLHQHKDFQVINKLAKHFWKVAQSKGFHDEPVPMSVSVSNLHSEVSEMWEAFRGNKLQELCDKAEKMQTMGLPQLTCLEEELADIFIRCLDTAHENGVDLARAIVAKDAYNQSRPHKNGGKAA